MTLRWHLQRGDIVFPKSMRVERMREDFALVDVELDAGDLATLSSMDRGEPGRTGPDPDVMNWIPE